MKNLIRRLSRVSHRASESSLRGPNRSDSKIMKEGRSGRVPEGHIPVYVGDEMSRFVVKAKLLNHPIFMELLNESADEYGYEQQGVLRIPCGVPIFERALEILRDEGHMHA